MTVKHPMAEANGSKGDFKRQKTDNGQSDKEREIEDPPPASDLVLAMAIKLTTPNADLNIPKHYRSDSDDEPIHPLDEKLSDSEITKDMMPPELESKKKKKKKKKSTEKSEETGDGEKI